MDEETRLTFARNNESLGKAIRDEMRRVEALGRQFNAEDAAQFGREHRDLVRVWMASIGTSAIRTADRRAEG